MEQKAGYRRCFHEKCLLRNFVFYEPCSHICFICHNPLYWFCSECGKYYHQKISPQQHEKEKGLVCDRSLEISKDEKLHKLRLFYILNGETIMKLVERRKKIQDIAKDHTIVTVRGEGMKYTYRREELDSIFARGKPKNIFKIETCSPNATIEEKFKDADFYQLFDDYKKKNEIIMESNYILHLKPNEGLQSYQKALKIYQELDYQEGEGRIYEGIGSLFNSMGKYDEALENHQRALKIYQKLDDQEGEGRIYEDPEGIYQYQLL